MARVVGNVRPKDESPDDVTKTTAKMLKKKDRNSTIEKTKQSVEDQEYYSDEEEEDQEYYSDDSDGSVIPHILHTEEVNQLKNKLSERKRKYFALKDKHKNLKNKFEEIYSLNISLQKKVVQQPTTATTHLCNCSLSVNTANASPSKDNTSFLTPPLTAENSSFLSESLPLSPVLSFSQQQSDTVADVDSNANNPVKSFVDEEKLKLIYQKAKPGSRGDSLFVKSLAVAVFGEATLAISSVTGQKCRRKIREKENAAKPQLCPERMLYIKGLFEKRINMEEEDTAEIEKRLKKMNLYIAEKIQTIVRYGLAEKLN